MSWLKYWTRREYEEWRNLKWGPWCGASRKEEPMAKMSWIREKLVEMYRAAGDWDTTAGRVEMDDAGWAGTVAARFLESQFEHRVMPEDSCPPTNLYPEGEGYEDDDKLEQPLAPVHVLIFRGEQKPTTEELFKRVFTRYAGDEDVKALAAALAAEKRGG